MSLHPITQKVTFGCTTCGKADLTCMGAAKTDEDKIYILCACPNCKEVVTFEINAIIAELYSTQSAPGSSKVN